MKGADRPLGADLQSEGIDHPYGLDDSELRAAHEQGTARTVLVGLALEAVLHVLRRELAAADGLLLGRGRAAQGLAGLLEAHAGPQVHDVGQLVGRLRHSRGQVRHDDAVLDALVAQDLAEDRRMGAVDGPVLRLKTGPAYRVGRPRCPSGGGCRRGSPPAADPQPWPKLPVSPSPSFSPLPPPQPTTAAAARPGSSPQRPSQHPPSGKPPLPEPLPVVELTHAARTSFGRSVLCPAPAPYCRRMRGSRKSRRASPARLKPSTASVMASPPASIVEGWFCM